MRSPTAVRCCAQDRVSVLSRRAVLPEVTADEVAGEADAISEEIVKLTTFCRWNGKGFEKIVKKYDKRLQMTVRPYVQARLMSQEFMNLRLDGYVLALSDIYGAVRAKRDTAVKGPGGGVWAPPSSFERNTKKYLIPSSDVWAVKLLVIKHMPVLVFGRDASAQGGIEPLDKVCVRCAVCCVCVIVVLHCVPYVLRVSVVRVRGLLRVLMRPAPALSTRSRRRCLTPPTSPLRTSTLTTTTSTTRG
jgi:hypothetical protein